MKELMVCFVLVILLMASSTLSHAQVSVTTGAKISATIVEPGTMAKTINTDFGNVAIILSAFVKMAPIGTHSTKGGIVLPVSSGTFTAAIYDYTGTTGLTYTVSYPSSPIIIKSGEDNMQVASFTSDPARNSGSDLIAGVFVSVTPSNVTVNYN
ncbi:MAG: DUF4402 domain-containing protein [Bacteroidales bacterium]